ncbi:MAG: hypothetical protein LAT68_09045 [Cyclobacteriaceae bacterium]|nr:hypothetical protein [Cyclobacteriaceae bacterium]MCH8516461.1 hypothetical protein [Cyclobacteriaceae bacterium]
MKFYQLLLSICLLFMFAACNKMADAEKNTNVDGDLWKKDAFGCEGYRLTVYREILDNEEYFLGKREADIQKFLGKPEINELYQRSQKFLHYVIEADDCDSQKPKARVKLSFRVNALGLTNSVSIRKTSD